MRIANGFGFWAYRGSTVLKRPSADEDQEPKKAKKAMKAMKMMKEDQDAADEHAAGFE
jgi:hypothetical protein